VGVFRLSVTNDSWQLVPFDLRSVVEAELAAGETVAAWVELDLDTQQRYAGGGLVLTSQRLLAIEPAETPDQWQARSWPLAATTGLRIKEYGSSGRLELLGSSGRIALWRYTIGRSLAVHRFVTQFERTRRSELFGDNDNADVTAICPSCGAILAAGRGTCPECDAVKSKPATAALYRVAMFVKPYKWIFVLGFLLMVSSANMSLVPMYLTGSFWDNVIIPASALKGHVPFSRVWWFLGGFIGASVLTWLLTWTRTYVMAWITERVAADMRSRTYAHMQSLSLEFFSVKRTGDLIARVSTDSDRISYFLSVYLLDFVNNVLMLAGISVILAYFDVKLAVATLLPLPFIAFLVSRVRNRMRRGFAMSSYAWGAMTSVLADTIPGIRVVKAFAQEHREIERFGAANDHVFSVNCRVNAIWAFFEPVAVLVTALGLAVVWGYGAVRIFQHDITAGNLYIFVGFMAMFYAKIDSMSRMVAAVQRAGASAHRIFAILDRVPSVAEPIRPVHPGRVKGEVEFRNVGFHYGSRPVLRGINLTVQPGEMIGLVGPSGAGKTTFVNLACRFYDVRDGAILVDGVDIRSFPIEEYRRNIGIVLQEPFLFYGTIAENIAYGRPNATRQEIVAAARAARAHEFVLRLPDGYDSLVGERGQFLSGGERQRISIARALLIDPRILILDEATSSVDTETEREIQLALENLVQGRTTIAIAHRLSTLRRANRLVVIERGQVTEVGPHDELLKRGGTYARLHQAQIEMHSRGA
jgi:ATP-binding cassette subfamily B protein